MELNLKKSNWRKVRFGDVVKKVTNKIDPNGYDSDIVIQGGHINKRDFHIRDVVEKPSIRSAPSNYAIIGRYILPKKIFNVLQKQKPGNNGEIHITDAIRTLIHQKNKFIGHVFAGKYLDCGTMEGYINSTKEISKL